MFTREYIHGDAPLPMKMGGSADQRLGLMEVKSIEKWGSFEDSEIEVGCIWDPKSSNFLKFRSFEPEADGLKCVKMCEVFSNWMEKNNETFHGKR